MFTTPSVQRVQSLTSVIVLGAALLLVGTPALGSDEPGWPREFTGPEGAGIVVFQPQVDGIDGNRVTGRAAVAVTPAGGDEQVFGAFWYDARLGTDFDTRTAQILDLTVPRVHFADGSEGDLEALKRLLETEVPKKNLDISIDRLLTSLGVSEARLRAAEGLNNEPPEIIFATNPTVLVLIDGDPVLRELDGSPFRYVVNSPFVIVEASGRFLLYAGHDTWYESRQATGPFRVTSSVPDELVTMVQEQEAAAEGGEPAGEAPAEPPAILVRTESAELVVSAGEPQYAPLAGAQLLAMSNTESDVVREIATQRTFVLLAGRWFVADSTDGPWAFVAPDELPVAFLDIEADGDMAHLRASVAGTAEAEEAVLDAQIPQTAEVRRDTTIDVEYDGEPIFETIQGTELEWAINTGTQVLRYEDRYYAVDGGVWFTAAAPGGPWEVATEVPDAIYTQPATSPTYNTSFVHVYDSTPTTVWVGYHPGFMWSFPHRGSLFWGTGWHHAPWIGFHHWPRHWTWGWSIRWDPFWGWSVGWSWSRGWWTFGMSWSTWGRTSRAHWVGVNSWNAGFRAGYHAGRRSSWDRRQNIYNRAQNIDRNVDRPRNLDGGRLAAAGQSNNVFTDRDGNVYRRNGDGSWQQRNQGQWQNTDLAARAGTAERGERMSQETRTNLSNRATSSQQSVQRNRGQSGAGSLNRDFNARQRGATRAQSFNRGGNQAAGGRGGGARLGGGRRGG